MIKPRRGVASGDGWGTNVRGLPGVPNISDAPTFTGGVLEPVNTYLPMVLNTKEAPGYLDGWWDPMLRAQLVLAEFAATAWRDHPPAPPNNSPENLAVRVSDLLAKRELRPLRAAEIISQSVSFVDDWHHLLFIEGGKRKNTAILVQIGICVGQMVGMYWKNVFKRARPAQIYPAILPVIPTPSHPSYPNNHAFQSHLIKLCVGSAIPKPIQPSMLPILQYQADRIAENREIGGVHFTDDTQAGERLAQGIFPLLAGLDVFETIRKAAAAEWEGYESIAVPEPFSVAAPPEADLISLIRDGFAQLGATDLDAR